MRRWFWRCAAAEPIPGFVRKSDGLELATSETGNPAGPAILVLHGFSQSALCWRGEIGDPALAAAIPAAVASLYQGIGHAPFVEDRPRFNRELAAFTFCCQHG